MSFRVDLAYTDIQFRAIIKFVICTHPLPNSHIAPIAQLVSALDLVTSSEQVECSILTAGKKLSEKSECNNSGYKLTGLTWWP